MSRAMPPLNPLRVFEAVARLGSFTKAAEELYVSQSAVSRQISLIEEYLGVKLFEREQRGVTLTAIGHAYQQDIGPAFAQISAATQNLLTSTRGGPIKVRAYTTFAAKWLMRRLPEFQEAHPDLEVRISTNVTPIDFQKENIDLAIQFGDGNWPGSVCERLLDDEIAPVCAPALLKGKVPLKTLEDLKQHRLLHSHYRKSDWPDWLSAVGRPELAEHHESMEFSSSILTYQAAVDGLGVAIGQIALLDQELEKGILVCPFEQIVKRPFAYYLLQPERHSTPRNVRIFREWLLDKIRATPSRPSAQASL
ncbi:transcriptional regulator GcvA [Noviherbaspirillum sedimenti]|uniref:Transcriptional regulator GcvA n=2 Tax=Noviherbaspirillum sedimenti TaxID=2320865 RepID=A0A3A3G7Q9_9BURK|nr:transcriptional regulator GcvA [Noviherbaspirillum sedimenti]